jgi:hypothetical protein
MAGTPTRAAHQRLHHSSKQNSKRRAMSKIPVKQALLGFALLPEPGNSCQGGRIFRSRPGHALDLCRRRAMIRETVPEGPVDGL